MSLWWARKSQLDDQQMELIENLPLNESQLILGPPGSGKTNILLRRAQFVRPQGKPSVLVLTFTRPLTEFIKTGCLNSAGDEIFPRSAVTTFESWIRSLYISHGVQRPNTDGLTLNQAKVLMAEGAMGLVSQAKIPRYDTLFVDEAQDLLAEEVALLAEWSDVLFFGGDSRQKIYDGSGLDAVRALAPAPAEHTLTHHYRLAPEICAMADRIMVSQSGTALANSEHYSGPRPGRIEAHGPMSRERQIARVRERLAVQVRAYADMIEQGDLLAVIVPRQVDRDAIFEALEADEALTGMSQVIKSRSGDPGDQHQPEIDRNRPIAIVTVQGCKGLEFRAVHFPFCDENNYYFGREHYYTVITRAKTSIDLYYVGSLPQILGQAYVPPVEDW